ncbi:sugar phosphate isomerase/epimerase [Akkermansiaceae bacterium]|nr:sugar phosphate isomerase/epimerase [Akkermansiaceae bacterium]
MRTAVTLSQVPEAAAGPFVFRQPLPEAFALAKETGFDDVELFLPGPGHVSVDEIKTLAQTHGLGIAAVGTGAGMVKHGLSLTDTSLDKRVAALDFLEQMIAFGGQLGAPAILGSMQGKWGGEVSREQALEWLSEALTIAGRTAAKYHVPFIYEPLNRYETNLINRLADGASFIESNSLENIVLLADMFHMNIEEQDLPAAIRAGGKHVGHVHYADSNRRAMGFGHTDPKPVIAALKEIHYTGHLSAEIFPLPDPITAANQTIQSISSVL